MPVRFEVPRWKLTSHEEVRSRECAGGRCSGLDEWLLAHVRDCTDGHAVVALRLGTTRLVSDL
jgi:hypothetical protein